RNGKRRSSSPLPRWGAGSMAGEATAAALSGTDSRSSQPTAPPHGRASHDPNLRHRSLGRRTAGAGWLRQGGGSGRQAPPAAPAPAPPADVKPGGWGHTHLQGGGWASGSVRFFDERGTSANGAVMRGAPYPLWTPPLGQCKVAILTQPPTNLSKAPPAKHAGN